MLPRLLLFALCAFASFAPVESRAQIRITEIMYHPVEEPAFNADGSPVLDLYEDVHEFVELHNAGAEAANLTGWELSGGIRFSFAAGTFIQPGEYLVVAKSPSRLKAVPAYQLGAINVLGPFEGQLSNKGDSVRLRNGSGETIDSVSYSAGFPWAISADALGADEEWTGLNPVSFQYRGRSLERVSMSDSSNDPANWLASPIPGNPSPGRPNSVQRAVPQPVVVDIAVTQSSNGAALIRAQEPVRISCTFTSDAGLRNVRLDWFVDDIEATGEPVQSVTMAREGLLQDNRFAALVPGLPDRTIVRYRIRGDRGSGDEVISPRADDPFPWHACFVTPVRTSSRPVYDCFISSNSLRVLNTNISHSPRRVTSPDPPGTPRASWNATEPAVLVHEGVVYDMRMRHHGSRYNRNSGRNSFKWQFPRYRKFNGVSGIFETDKGNDFIVGHGLFRAAGFPVSAVRSVDLYLNNRNVMQRLEQGEFDGDMLDEFHRNQRTLNPGADLEPSGEIYKDVGTIDMNGEGPYGRGDGRLLSKLPHWTDLQMYEWTYSLQNHGWRGMFYWKQMIDAFWAARGDSPLRLGPDVPALRIFFTNYFDVDEMLSYIAVENWCCPWDDSTQNHFFWQRRNGKWGMLPWDSDAWFGRGDNTPAESSIFIGEVGDPNNNYRGPNFFKDAFIKAFREELKERLFLLNNTFLHPDNLAGLGLGSIRSFAQARMISVNEQCGLGVFERPAKPSGLSPSGSRTALPPETLNAGPYGHSSTPASPHARTIWEIRAADSSYAAPVWKQATSTNLTSVAIPFDKLRFGQRYYWRCTYVDADDHPSVPADEASFTFGPAPAERALITIGGTDQWRYDQSGTDLSGVPWTDINYDDSTWPSGVALFAKEESALPEMIRTPLTLGRRTYYFRKLFQFPGQPGEAAVRLKHIVDDGCIVYINGKECLRVRMPEGPVTSTTLANGNVGNAALEGPVDLPGSLFVPGLNVIAVEVHQSSASSSDVVFGLSLEATLPLTTGAVVLNEIAARNSGLVQAPGGATSDWIELYNSGTAPVDLSGHALSDDLLRPRRFVFPPDTIIEGLGYLTIWCDGATNGLGLHTGFGLHDEGQTVALFAPSPTGLAICDYVSFGSQLADLTIGRYPDGAGKWQLAQPTYGGPNHIVTLATASGLKVNEWMASVPSDDDWFEIYNPAELPVALGGLFLTDDLANPQLSRIADLSFIAGHGFVKFIADEAQAKGADHVQFKLSADGELIALLATNGVTLIDVVHFGPQVSGVSSGRFPDGGETIVAFPSAASPGSANHLENADPPWRLSIVRDSTSGFVVHATGRGSGSLVLQVSSDLARWTDLMSRSSSDGGFDYSVPEAYDAPARYYRLVLLK